MSALPQLAFLLGEFRGQEIIHPSQWGPGATAQARVSCRQDLAGKALLQDSVTERDGQPWLAVHAVFGAGAQAGEVRLWWFDSFGFAPEQPAPGRWDGAALTFTRSSPRGQTRHTYAPREGGGYTHKLESSFDGGASWVAVMDGSYAPTRQEL